MKREIIIRLLQEYITHKPGHSFEEIHNYADDLGATDEELNQAVMNNSNSTSKPTKKRFGLNIKRPKIMTLPVQLSIIFGCSMVISVALYTEAAKLESNRYATLSNLNVVSPVQKTQKNLDMNIPLIKPKAVFANESIVDAKKVFSFPKSQVTLKYSGTPKKEVFGFFPYWMLEVEDQVNIDGYTSISLFALDTDEKGNIIITNANGEKNLGWEMWNDPKLNDFLERVKKKKIKIYLTIKNFNNNNIEELISSDENQQRFIANAIALVNSKSLDGLNIDFEYVGKASDKIISDFTRFAANINSELKRQIPNAVFTIDTYIRSASNLEFFDVQLLQEHTDALVIMGYDVHTPNGPSGPIAPMEGDNSIIGFMQSYLERVSPEKLILAVPYYGYSWPIDSSLKGGKILSYAEIANQSKEINIQWDDTAQTPYYQYLDSETKINRILHFENTRSLGIKYDYIKNKNLKGVGVWAMGYEGLNKELEQLIFEKFAQ